MIICKRCQVWTKSLKRWILMGYDTGARNPVSLRALSPSNTQKGKCETSKAQREQFVHRRDQNKETFSTSLLQVQWLKKTHLQDTLNNKASPLIYEQEGIKGKCSRTSNAICGSLPLNKKLITNNLWLTAAISLRLTLTDWNLINRIEVHLVLFHHFSELPLLTKAMPFHCCNPITALSFVTLNAKHPAPQESTLPVEDIAWHLLQILKRICHLLHSLLPAQVRLDQGHWVCLPFQKVLLGYCGHCT